MDFSNTDVWGFEHAIRGMRNPLESHIKSDSWLDTDGKVVVGANDLDLMKRLIRGGSEHRKFMRQIMVSVDISAPLYIWKEFDTYKIGTTANSTSTSIVLCQNQSLCRVLNLTILTIIWNLAPQILRMEENRRLL